MTHHRAPGPFIARSRCGGTRRERGSAARKRTQTHIERGLQDVAAAEHAHALARRVNNCKPVHLAPHDGVRRVLQPRGVHHRRRVVTHLAGRGAAGLLSHFLLLRKSVPHAAQAAPELLAAPDARKHAVRLVDVARRGVQDQQVVATAGASGNSGHTHHGYNKLPRERAAVSG